MVGWLLKCFVWLVESWFFPPIRALLERSNKIPQTLQETEVDDPPLFTPVHLHHHVSSFPEKELKAADAVSKANLASVVAGWPMCWSNCLSSAQICSLKASAYAVDCSVLLPTGGAEQKKGHPVWSATQLRVAYTSGHLTPTKVAQSALKHIAESQDNQLTMSYFIACDAHDVLQQAEQSTIRYTNMRTLFPPRQPDCSRCKLLFPTRVDI